MGPRLTGPRRIMPPRASAKKAISTSTPTPVIAPPKEEEESPAPVKVKYLSTNIQKVINPAAIGGVNLFGGINLGSIPLKKSTITSSSDAKPKTRLYQLKGRRRVRSYLVEVSSKSLNKGDVFILDTGYIIL